MQRALVALSFAISSAAAACTITREDPPKSTADPAAAFDVANLDAWCGDLCAKTRACQPTTDAASCVASCKAQNAAVAAHSRAEYMSDYLACITGLTCESLITGGATRCPASVAAGLDSTQIDRDYCAQAVAHAGECGASTTQEDCVARTKQFDDDSVRAATSCWGKACGAPRNDCFSTALGVSNQ